MPQLKKEILAQYQSDLSKYSADCQIISKKLTFIVVARLIVFSSTIGLIYWFFGVSTFLIPGILLGILIFLLLLRRDGNLREEKKYLEARIKLLEEEFKLDKMDFSGNRNGNQYINPDHYYSYDIDLFGPGSFFQRINRTRTQGGQNILAAKLSENECTQIKDRQKTVQLLSSHYQVHHDFWAKARTEAKTLSPEAAAEWFLNYSKTIKWNTIRLVCWIFPVLSLLILILTSLELIQGFVLIYWIIFGLVIAAAHGKKSKKLVEELNVVHQTIASFGDLIQIIEDCDPLTNQIKELQEKINTPSHKASALMNDFTRLLDNFNHRNNFVVGILGNAFLLWDFQCISRIDKWMQTHQNVASNWFESIYDFDALLCLANYAHNHPEYTYPVIWEQNEISATGFGHPLLKSEKRINNDFSLKYGTFNIITGANMAGKSTFLRTVSLGICMANAGLPVCSETFKYNPIKLITSMRTSDNLEKEESYFFSELKRLKYITSAINRENYFIILDEILKGTNSKDKEEGSKKFLQKLISHQTTGIIATHDLGLCTLSDNITVFNYYFDADIVNDELYFDYKMKPGICQNMNASFLLKKMEIVD